MVLLMMAITAATVGMKLVIDCWLRFYYFQCWFVVRC